MKKPIYVTFASPKGGVGKTMLTVLTASYLHYTKDYNVAVVDCCYPEYGVGLLRKNEIERIDKEVHYYTKARKQFTDIKKKTYSIIDTRVERAIGEAEKLQDVDIVLFDIPAVMSVEGTIELLGAMDYIIFPVMNGSWVMNAVPSFIEVMNQRVITTGKGNVRAMYLLRNMVGNWEETKFHLACQQVGDDTEVIVMDAILPYSKNFRKDVFYTDGPEVCVSTVFPFDKRYQGMLGELMVEMEQIVSKLCGKY